MARRLPVEKFVNPTILGEELVFPTSKRVAKNRFLKVGFIKFRQSDFEKVINLIKLQYLINI